MNIFKVFASGKKTMSEEQMTSILAWLLHPQMEHGLGHEFLSRFIKSISAECPKLLETADNLRNRLRGEPVSDFGMELEDNVPGAFVDMLISIDDWKIGVENKIYPTSASDPQQLNREYRGLIEKYGGVDKDSENKTACALIFLVPADEFGELHSQVKRECDSFDQKQIRSGDFFQLMTWQENNAGYPSVILMLEGLLQDESAGKTEPISDYTRHTLKALAMFIRGDFSGYDYERMSTRNAYPYFKTSEILKKTSGIVGIKGGLTGLLRQSGNDLKGAEYQYSESDSPHHSCWISVDDFKQIYNWRVSGAPPVIKWDRKRLSAEILYDIVSACTSQSLYIGIRGGMNALQNMGRQTIQNSAWQLISADEAPGSQWISGDDFRKVLDEKGVSK